MVSSVKDAEHAPLGLGKPRKDILLEEIQSSLGASYKAKTDSQTYNSPHTPPYR